MTYVFWILCIDLCNQESSSVKYLRPFWIFRIISFSVTETSSIGLAFPSVFFFLHCIKVGGVILFQYPQMKIRNYTHTHCLPYWNENLQQSTIFFHVWPFLAKMILLTFIFYNLYRPQFASTPMHRPTYWSEKSGFFYNLKYGEYNPKTKNTKCR